MYKRWRKNISLFVLAALLLSGCGDITIISTNGNNSGKKPDSVAEAATGNDSASSGMTAERASMHTTASGAAASDVDYNVSFDADNKWDGGFQGTIRIKNTGRKTFKDWKLVFEYVVDFASSWNGNIKKKGNEYTITGVDWNSDIKPGETAEVGFIGDGDYREFPSEYQFTYDTDPYETPSSETSVAPDETATPAPSAAPSSASTATPTPTSSNPSATSTPKPTKKPSNDVVVSGTVKKHGRLRVKGAKIVDKKGRTFIIKGPSTHGIAWFPQYVNTSCFKFFKKKGANTVRLACYTSTGEGYNTGSVWKTIDRGVKAATKLGMYVIIDWHILNENNPKTTLGPAKKFFKHFAKKYGKRKNVIWEICNEPHWCEWKTDIKPYAKKIIKLIRKYSKNIIVVGTPTWSQDVDVVAQSRLTGKYKKNTCYTLHFYAGTHKEDLRRRVTQAAKKKLPILCTEFSLCDASGDGALDKKSAKAWMNLFKKYKIGYVAWNISNKAESSSFFKPSCQKTKGFTMKDVNPSGRWVIKQWK